MGTSSHSWGREWAYTPLVLLALLCLNESACASTSLNNTALIQDPRGFVSLQPIPNPSVHTSHPVNFEITFIARILDGIQIRETPRALQQILEGSTTGKQVFSPEDIQFLAPRITNALARATKEETVAFVVTNFRQNTETLQSSVTENTVGSLYVDDVSFHLTFSQYRYVPTQTNAGDLTHRRIPDSSGLVNQTLLFTPTVAQQPINFDHQTKGRPTDRSLAIDYHLLLHAPLSITNNKPHEPLVITEEPNISKHSSEFPAQQEIQTLKDLVIKKSMEMESLKDALQDVKKQLENQKRKLLFKDP